MHNIYNCLRRMTVPEREFREEQQQEDIRNSAFNKE